MVEIILDKFRLLGRLLARDVAQAAAIFLHHDPVRVARLVAGLLEPAQLDTFLDAHLNLAVPTVPEELVVVIEHRAGRNTRNGLILVVGVTLHPFCVTPPHDSFAPGKILFVAFEIAERSIVIVEQRVDQRGLELVEGRRCQVLPLELRLQCPGGLRRSKTPPALRGAVTRTRRTGA